MNSPHEKQVAIGDVFWTLRDSSAAWAPPLVTPYLDRLGELPGARLIKRTMVRTLVAVAPPSSPSEVVIKVHRCPRLLERLKHTILPSKAAREWEAARLLTEARVPTFKPIAFAERRRGGLLDACCLISEALPRGDSLHNLLAGPLRSWADADRLRLFNDLAVLVRRMHWSHIVHNDLHAGNVLCQLDERAAQLYLLDLHAARKVRRLTWRARRQNLVILLASLLVHTSLRERRALLSAYARGDAALERIVARQGPAMEKAADAYARWVRRVRTARCLQRSSEFDVQHIDRAKVYFRRAFPVERIRETLNLHAAAVAARSGQVIKSSTRGHLTSLAVQNDRDRISVVVKQSRPYGWKERIEAIFRGPESRRIWLAANGLKVRGIAACELLAAGERRRFGLLTQTFVIMKALEDCTPLDRYLHPRLTYLRGHELARFKGDFAQRLARFLAALHQKRVFHSDLKPSNIMVRERPGQELEFILIDLDRVRFDREVSPRRRARNLAQLDSAFQHRLTNTDRLRCFRAYIVAAPEIRDPRGFLAMIRRRTEKLLRYNRRVIERMLAQLKPEDLALSGSP